MSSSVMIVDDDSGVLTWLEIGLRRARFDVFKAQSGQAALHLLEQATPDIFVLDIMMPGIDGIELCRRLRANLPTAYTPILMLSASNDERDKVASFEVGATDYLAKPTPLQVLVAKIQELLHSENH